MHVNDFIAQKVNLTTVTMRELVGELEKGHLQREMSTPKTAADLPPVNLRKDLEQLCFVAVGNEVRKFKVGDGKLHACPEPVLSGHFYEGLAVFEVGNVPYLAAGYSQGIQIVNLDHPDERRYVVVDGKRRESCFKDIIVKKDGPNLEDQTLLATHSGKGVVIKVGLNELVSQEQLRVRGGNKRNIFWKSTEGYHLRISLDGQKIYLAEGKTVYQTNSLETPQEEFKISNVITALDVQEGKVCTGSQRGRIWMNGERYWGNDVSTSLVSKVQLGEYDGRAGVFFTTFTSSSFSRVKFTDGKEVELVSPKEDIRSRALDFHYGPRSFVLERDKLLLLEGGNIFETPLQSNRQGARARSLHIYGG